MQQSRAVVTQPQINQNISDQLISTKASLYIPDIFTTLGTIILRISESLRMKCFHLESWVLAMKECFHCYH